MTAGGQAQIGNVDLVKQLNSAAVYRLIDQHGPISRIQIAEQSQLAPASVTKITRQLIERGLIKEVDQQASTGGLEPIYETMPGWSETTFGVKERSGLPQAALNYIQRIEELTGVPVDIISTGPDRTETMILRDPFDA